MKNIWLGIALGIGAAGVVVAIVLALSGDEQTVVVEGAVPPAGVASAGTSQESGTATESAAGASEAVNTSGSVEQSARAYCEREQRDPDDFARDFGSGQAGMANCIETEIRKAGSECEVDLRNDRDDYVRQFGGADEAAFKRCLKYELSS